MYLNNLKPSEGSRSAPKRLGRGIGSGLGKTSGKGHKGQKARSGGYHKVGFEGGQMPLQRRLPKRGFRSLNKKMNVSLRTGELDSLTSDVVLDIAELKKLGVVPVYALSVKVYLSGAVNNPVKLKGITVSKGALEAIEKAGGSVEE